MNIIGINGSPHKEQNTATLVKSALDGAKSEGAQVELYNLYDMDIDGCHGCLTCKEEETCSIDDDFTKHYDDFTTADGLVIGSPIYVLGMTARAKAFQERFWRDSINRKSRTIDAILVFTQGNEIKHGKEPSIEETMIIPYSKLVACGYSNLGINIRDSVLAGRCSSFRKDVSEENIKEAFEAGRKMALGYDS